ncbi:MAG: hypothetical protein M3Z25_15010 [Actinomycetota bacterium]|nr:hypothetical protein [Actinomycetota bacterium]
MPLLTVGCDRAEGHFLLVYGGFMPVRQDRRDMVLLAFQEVNDDQGDARPTNLSAEVVVDDQQPFEFFAALLPVAMT